MKKLIILLAVVACSCKRGNDKTPHVIIETSLGDIEIELYAEKAPVTTAAFLSYIDSGYYSKSSFYRVLKADELPNDNNTGVIQGGIWKSNPERKVKIPGIKHEPTSQTGLSHVSGTISLARLQPGTANTEFFICIGDQNQFDYGQTDTEDGLGYAAFGKVVTGMPVVREIQEQKSHGDQFDKPIQI